MGVQPVANKLVVAAAGGTLASLPRLAAFGGARRPFKTSAALASGGDGHGKHEHSHPFWFEPEKRGDREVVGWTIHGQEQYDDRLDFFFPAIRFRANDALITPLREKELGDWKSLTKDEMKLLYRYSFRQTLAEFEAPNGYAKLEWMEFFLVLGACFLFCTFQEYMIFARYPPPDTFDDEYKEAIMEKQLVMERGNFIGPAHEYDYEKNRWKD